MKVERPRFRSPMFYVGDKYKIFGEISQYFPADICRFIEPFTGGGSVFMNVTAKEYMLNDIDSYMVGLHKFLIESSEERDNFFASVKKRISRYGLSRSYEEDIIPIELKKEYKKSYLARFNKDSYIRLREDFNKRGRKSMLDLYLLLIYGFNRMLRFNRQGNFNLPVGNVDFNTNVKRALNDYFDIVQSRRIDWSNSDYREFLGSFDFVSGDFVYLDPPYLITFSEYNKLWSESDERDLVALLDELHARGVKFAISNVTHYKGRENSIFIEWAQKYNSYPIKSNYISYHDNTIKDFKEVLVTNYAKL